MAQISVQIFKYIDPILSTYTPGNTSLLSNGLNTKKEQNLKLKTKKKEKLPMERFVAIVRLLKVLSLNTKCVPPVSQDFTVVKIVKDKTGNKVTTKSAKKSKKELRSESFLKKTYQ